ncbi:Oidioi.mRNA.OKI2018_I69.XSR.g16546.t1.cds [Oikopleura dioica]|uniref:Oidioi.mRNA.OKI2018_I69.XSR.g16546.t1.cds n=1 Tax=Oikopleura dioica TaxID=34765 RepID=A0ABN7SGX9_OIKDI|nr:Oidioi.mRNA.OKI2018_I69.XSR.g16546.t1.cds [Oikopleura dioica]
MWVFMGLAVICGIAFPLLILVNCKIDRFINFIQVVFGKVPKVKRPHWNNMEANEHIHRNSTTLAVLPSHQYNFFREGASSRIIPNSNAHL